MANKLVITVGIKSSLRRALSTPRRKDREVDSAPRAFQCVGRCDVGVTGEDRRDCDARGGGPDVSALSAFASFLRPLAFPVPLPRRGGSCLGGVRDRRYDAPGPQAYGSKF